VEGNGGVEGDAVCGVEEGASGGGSPFSWPGERRGEGETGRGPSAVRLGCQAISAPIVPGLTYMQEVRHVRQEGS
jgi:hypothetical protein